MHRAMTDQPQGDKSTTPYSSRRLTGSPGDQPNVHRLSEKGQGAAVQEREAA
jgi:hypothetical protein